MNPTHQDRQHRWYEDIAAILIGTLLVALGVSMYKHAILATGGINGLALLLGYTTPMGFALWFFLLNLPFYIFAWQRLGAAFTLKTFASVALVSLFAQFTPDWASFLALNTTYATIMGGILMGMGLLVLFRHKSGLGGVNILAVYVQERYGLRAGYIQMGVDIAILAGAFFTLPLDKVAFSILGAIILNLVLAMNFRSERYIGFSGVPITRTPDKSE